MGAMIGPGSANELRVFHRLVVFEKILLRADGEGGGRIAEEDSD